jgi:hypothetical protein
MNGALEASASGGPLAALKPLGETRHLLTMSLRNRNESATFDP